MFWKRRPQPEEAERNLQQHAAIVEQILSQIGVDSQQARMSNIRPQDGYGWHFQRGSALIEVYIDQEQGREYLRVLSPMLHLPQHNLLPLYRRLLELNLSLTNASVGIYLDVVYVFNERPLEGLDRNEADYIINQIAQYADHLDNQLLDEFGGRLFNQV